MTNKEIKNLEKKYAEDINTRLRLALTTSRVVIFGVDPTTKNPYVCKRMPYMQGSEFALSREKLSGKIFVCLLPTMEEKDELLRPDYSKSETRVHPGLLRDMKMKYLRSDIEKSNDSDMSWLNLICGKKGGEVIYLWCEEKGFFQRKHADIINFATYEDDGKATKWEQVEVTGKSLYGVSVSKDNMRLLQEVIRLQCDTMYNHARAFETMDEEQSTSERVSKMKDYLLKRGAI